jgi:TusA-related sulfurtransferase
MYLEPQLDNVPPGGEIDVIVDHICAVEGIPAFVKQLGHEVLSVTMIRSGVWRIRVQKGTRTVN